MVLEMNEMDETGRAGMMYNSCVRLSIVACRIYRIELLQWDHNCSFESLRLLLGLGGVWVMEELLAYSQYEWLQLNNIGTHQVF